MADDYYEDDDYEDDDYYDTADKSHESISQITKEFRKKGYSFSLSYYSMPNCCSGFVLGGGYVGGKKKPTKEELVTLVNDILKAAHNYYSWVISTLLMGSQGEWAQVLLEAGFEESKQVSTSNSYNGSQPLRVFTKALRPMNEKEVEEALKKYAVKSEKARKGGYEW